MTEESISKQSGQTTKGSQTNGKPSTKESKTDTKPSAKEPKTDGQPSTKAEKQEDRTPRHEGQKMVTDSYRRGWERIWKKKS
jgi:hypothetical protein